MNRVLVALLAVVAMTGAGPARAGPLATDGDPEIQTWWGSAGAVPIASQGGALWSEIVVDLQPVKAVHGHLELSEVARGAPNERVVDRRDVDLTPNTPSRVHLPARVDRSYRVRLVGDHGEHLWHSTVALRGNWGPLVVALGVESPLLPRNAYIAGEGATALHAMPRFSETYESVTLFFTSSTTLAELDEAACAPLVSWIRSGGSLVVVESDDGSLARARCGLGPLERSSTLIEGTPFGLGQVITTEADVLTSRPQQIEMLSTTAATWRPDRYPGDRAYLPPVDHSARLALAGILITIFGVLVGPVSWLRQRRRQTPSVHVPVAVVSLATFGGMVLVGSVFAPRPHTTTHVLREFISGQPKGRATHTRVFHAPSGPVRTRQAHAGALLGGYASDARSDFRLEPDGTIVLNEGNPPVSDHVYLVESIEEDLPGPITIGCTPDVCTIDNATGAPLHDAQLYLPSRGIFELGTVDRTRRVELHTKATSPSIGSDERHAFLLSSGAHVSFVGAHHNQPTAWIGVTCSHGCETAR